MSKAKSFFVCQACGVSHSKWSGQCPDCFTWDTMVEEVTASDSLLTRKDSTKSGHSLTFSTLHPENGEVPRAPTSIAELDRVLGGGFVAGSATLVGGDPGIGKSTLLLQTVAKMADKGKRCVYISGEESIGQIQLRAARLGVTSSNVELSTTTSVRDILTAFDTANSPDVLIVDSVQTMAVDTIDAAPGTVSQVRAASHELIRMAKRRSTALILVGHVTKDGQIAGPRVLEHMVDTVLYFEGDRGHQFRIIRSVKNRFGSTDEIGVFAMTEKGLEEVPNPSSLFLQSHQEPVSGSVVFVGVEGSRPFLVEIQALVAPSMMANPRRAVVGWDSGRLAMIVAVLEARCGVRLSDKEIYLNVAGGFKVSEPAADLAVAVAILSAIQDEPVSSGTVVFGEIGLSGEVRPVGRAELRLKESAKLGFTHAFCPQGKMTANSGMSLTTPAHLRDMVLHFAPKPVTTA